MPLDWDVEVGIHSDRLNRHGPLGVAISLVAEAPSDGWHDARRFVAGDGNVYWIKTTAAHGLCVELIAGRLAYGLGIGPSVSAMEVPSEGAAVAFGSMDIDGTVSTQELELFFPDLRQFDLATLDQASLALTFVFQVWIGHRDPQWLIRMEDGRVFTLDHEEWAADSGYRLEPWVLTARVPGMPDYLRGQRTRVLDAVARIEAISDAELVEAVSCLPDAAGWDYDPAQALAVAEALAERRVSLRGVMERWLLP